MDELLQKFPREVRESGLESHNSLDDIESVYRSGDREALVNLNMQFNYAVQDFRRAECNLNLAFDTAFAEESKSEEIE